MTVRNASYLSLLLVLGLTSACATKTETTRYYLLSDPAQVSLASDRQCSARVGAVSIAPYLQRTHIVLQSGANELIPALQHRWSEPMDAGVTRLLSGCLGGAADAPNRATVSIDHLHGSTDGSVVLQAQWAVSGETLASDTQASGSFSASLPQPRAGYDALVSTQRELVLLLCADIQAALPGCR